MSLVLPLLLHILSAPPSFNFLTHVNFLLFSPHPPPPTHSSLPPFHLPFELRSLPRRTSTLPSPFPSPTALTPPLLRPLPHSSLSSRLGSGGCCTFLSAFIHHLHYFVSILTSFALLGSRSSCSSIVICYLPLSQPPTEFLQPSTPSCLAKPKTQ